MRQTPIREQIGEAACRVDGFETETGRGSAPSIVFASKPQDNDPFFEPTVPRNLAVKLFG